MAPPTYTSSEFVSRFIADETFLELYERWVLSDFHTLKKPSIDRINNEESYTWENIQMVDWKTNLYNANKITNPVRLHKPVIQVCRTTGAFLQEFPSIVAAHAATGINKSHISSVCKQNTNRVTAGGFKWIYRN